MNKFKCSHCNQRFSRESFALHLKNTFGGTTCLKINKVYKKEK